MTGTFPIEKFKNLPTPFYFYDTHLLRTTLEAAANAAKACGGAHIHYAVKANANPALLQIISQAGYGADCVSGGEIERAVSNGFPAAKIVFAGVGKTDAEIRTALAYDIACFNVESLPELAVIDELAGKMGKTACVAFRINPNVDAHTLDKITTGLNENKFGIAMQDMKAAIDEAGRLKHVQYVGLHFHIGSQITDMRPFAALCARINDLQDELDKEGIRTEIINVGGGLGIDYDAPEAHPIPDFNAYFQTFRDHLQLRPGQQLHFELGRSLVAQCGSLIARVLYMKQGTSKKFLILDAGFTDLIRPAMYQAYHKVENLSAPADAACTETYDVVGPICESSDVFVKDMPLPPSSRGDLMAFRSAGAYGEVMASTYNCRHLPQAYIDDEI